MMAQWRIPMFCTVVLLFTSLACSNILTPTSDAEVPATPQLELAVDADLTPLPTATAVQAQIAATATSIPTQAPSPTPCFSDAIYVADLTIPDNTVLAPNTPIDKQWQIRNNGDCAWNADYRIIFSEGALMNANVEHAVYPAKAGGDATVQIDMVAPDVPGEYRGYWQLVDGNGQPFGQRLYIQIIVGN